jgi:hypothetical protein
MSSNTQAAMQIRYLETLASMSKHAGSKVIFMPLEQTSKTGAMNKAALLNATERLAE